MKDRLLLIMPFFMEYENALYVALSQRFEVTLVNGDEFIREARNIYYSNKARRFLRKLVPYIRNVDQERVLNLYIESVRNKIVLEADYYDVILCINGHGCTNRFYNLLFSSNPFARKIIYLWDDMTNLFKNSHVELFDEKYTYNVEDASKQGMVYLPMFTQCNESEVCDYSQRKYDITVIASVHSDRVEIVKKLYAKYKDSLRWYIYFYDPNKKTDFFSYEKPLSYSEYIRVIANSKTVIDIPNTVQKGPTTRFVDAFMVKTKVITTNDNIVSYPFYNDNVCIIDRDLPLLDTDFVSKPFSVKNDNKYDVGSWINQIGL